MEQRLHQLKRVLPHVDAILGSLIDIVHEMRPTTSDGMIILAEATLKPKKNTSSPVAAGEDDK